MGEPVTITINAEKLREYINSAMEGVIRDAMNGAAAKMFEFVITPEDFRKWAPRPRIASRQACLWRHSFDWRNRKRGHPVHR